MFLNFNPLFKYFKFRLMQLQYYVQDENIIFPEYFKTVLSNHFSALLLFSAVIVCEIMAAVSLTRLCAKAEDMWVLFTCQVNCG